MRLRRITAPLVLALAIPSVAPCADREDPEAAERQYRIARRLAVEGSPQAATALRKVLELDPRGPLADDALLEEALLSPLAAWPEEIGRLDMVAAPRVRTLLDRILSEYARGDRAYEARYRRALLRLEPVPGHDAGAARTDLIEVATAPEAGAWGARSRYALAWLLERDGQHERAGEAYARIVIEASESEVGTLARAALGRVALREERFGDAARWLQSALERDLPEHSLAAQLRECAVRRLLDETGNAGREGEAVTLVVDAVSGMAATPDGVLLLSDRRGGRVQGYREDGTLAAEWFLDAPTGIVLDEAGRGYALDEESLYRLDAGGTRTHVASVGDYAPAIAFAAGRGGFWVLDRKGQRIGRIQPGAPAPRGLWEGRGSKLVAMIWDGRRLVVLDSRSRTLIAIAANGTPRTLATSGLARPNALAADPSGRIAVLDSRAGEVSILNERGAEVKRFSTAELGMERPSALTFGIDGRLHLFDEESGLWVRLP